jgi:hypothetical protein
MHRRVLGRAGAFQPPSEESRALKESVGLGEDRLACFAAEREQPIGLCPPMIFSD